MQITKVDKVGADCTFLDPILAEFLAPLLTIFWKQLTKVDRVGPIIDNNKAGEIGEGDDDTNALRDNQDLDV